LGYRYSLGYECERAEGRLFRPAQTPIFPCFREQGDGVFLSGVDWGRNGKKARWEFIFTAIRRMICRLWKYGGYPVALILLDVAPASIAQEKGVVY